MDICICPFAICVRLSVVFVVFVRCCPFNSTLLIAGQGTLLELFSVMYQDIGIYVRRR